MSKPFNIGILGLKNVFENTSIHFVEDGCIVRVSINITYDLTKHLIECNISKADKFYTYSLSHKLMSYQINKGNMQRTHDWLLKNCMIAVREAKQKKLQEQIIKLSKPTQLNLNFAV